MERISIVRTARRLVVAVALALLVVPLAALPAAGAAGPAGLVREAWFQAPLAADATPLCAAPTGCSPTRAGFPDDTLHVGNLNGSTSELTTITFDRSVVPATARLTGGTAVLPVAGADAGTFAAESATLVACLVVEPFEEVDGAAAGEAPAHDCSVRAPATYDAEADPASFVVDLAPFVPAWEDGRGQGIALVPDTSDVGTWHVAFSGRERSAEGAVPPPSAELVWLPADETVDAGTTATDTTSQRTPAEPAATAPPEADSNNQQEAAPDVAPGTTTPPPAPVGARPPAVAPGPTPSEPAPAEAPVAAPSAPDTAALPVTPVAVPIGYAYRWGWVLPLLVLLAGTSLTRSLATEVRVTPASAPRGLGARLWLAIWPDDEA